MISIQRWIASTIPFIYAMYLPVQSMLLPNPLERKLELIALAIYVACAIPSLFLYRGIKMPLFQAGINFASAILMPALVITQRSELGDNSTGGWVVMGTAIILTATAVRQQRVIAIAGSVALIAQMFATYGLIVAISGGLIGALVIVLAGLGVSAGIQRANEEVTKYRAEEQRSKAEIATIAATRAERASRLQEILGSAIPMLTELAALRSPLSSERKLEAKVLELSLRDEIRGRNLLSPELKEAVSRLRKLGVEVAVLDEGGMDHLDLEVKGRLLAQVVEALAEITQGRVTIRSPKGESFVVTVVATLPKQAKPLLNLRLTA